tara:strand:+ start:2016 stop:3716 length:1701 start_codon:yes stop_codon:yes gene_type:complete
MSLLGFDFNIFGHTNIVNQNKEYAICISPNQEFSSCCISEDNIHVVFNVDISGSMTSYLTSGNQYQSRIELTKKCLKECAMFLYTLASEGKNVYISIVTFSNNATTIISRKNLKTEEDCNYIIDKIESIHAGGATNLGTAIVETIDICNINSSDNIYKILISDGFVNVGVVGVPQIKQDYKHFYNACIGIGNETDYDKSLLQTLSHEEHERSCFSIIEMKDQIIDSIFSNVNKIADKIVIKNKESIMDYVRTDSKAFIDNGTIQTNFKFTTKEFFVVNKSKCIITITGVSKNYLESSGFDISDTFTTSFNNLFIGEILVSLTENINNTADINIEIEFNNSKNYESKTNSKSFRKIQTFIDISNQFLGLDLENVENNKIKKLRVLTDKIDTLLKNISKDNNQKSDSYIKNVIEKFKESIIPFLDNDSLSNLTNPNLSTPYRMLRAQTSSGSYAFVGRQASMGYSMGINDFTNQSESDSEEVPSAPTITIPSSPSEIMNVTPPALYSSNIGASTSLGFFANSPNNVTSALTPPLLPPLPISSHFTLGNSFTNQSTNNNSNLNNSVNSE